MARFFPEIETSAGAISEQLVRAALQSLDDTWSVVCHSRWVEPSRTRSDFEADFVLLHPIHGGIVLEAKGGSFQLREGTWWTVDRRGRLQPLGRRGPFQQAVDAKHGIRRRLTGSCPRLAERIGHAVCFTDGRPDGELGAEAPKDIVLSMRDFDRFEDALVGVSCFFGYSHESMPLADDELSTALAALAPSARVVKDEPRLAAATRKELDQLGEARLELTAHQLAGLDSLGRAKPTVVRGPAGTGKTVLAVNRARQLLNDGASVLILCSSAQLVGFFRETLDGDHPGQLHIGRSSSVLPEGLDVLRPSAVLVDEAQNLSAEHLAALGAWVKENGSELDLFCDVEQIRDPVRRAAWAVPFDHEGHRLVENLRNTRSIVEAMVRLGYVGFPMLHAAIDSALELELVECSDGAVMRAATLQILYDLLNEEHFSQGQIALISEAGNEMSRLCTSLDMASSTDAWEFGRRRRNRLDIGSFADFQGLEREVVVVMEPTLSLVPPALDRPSGASSVPRSERGGTALDDDLSRLLAMSLSRARSKVIVLGGRRLATVLGLPVSDRSIRAHASGRGSVIEVHGVRLGPPASARGTRRSQLS
jgi:hypothetical protein